jgi:hypothetical protein
MILLDFYGGSHGHFLEYVVNSYIFRGPRVKNIFTELGTSHRPNQNLLYSQSKMIHCGHYSEFNLPVTQEPTQVVRISVDTKFEKTVYQINIMYRAGDIPAEKKLMNIPAVVRNHAALLRNDYYAKLTDDTGYIVPKDWKLNQIPSYNFPMGSLYNLYEFYNELQTLADFLKHSFNPDHSLVNLWREFMQKNQGWQCWNQAEILLEKVLANENYKFLADTWTQAVLNSFLSQCVGIYDGKLFENSDYPTNTQHIYAIIQKHLVDFDQRY